MRPYRRVAALAAVFFVCFISRAAPGVTVELKNGDVDSGWVVHFEDGLGVAFLGVANDRAEVRIQKAAQFTEAGEGGVGSVLQLVFEQVSADATRFITIDSESVTNQTGQDWTGFRFAINNVENPSSNQPVIDPSQTFFDDDPFNIDPFSTFAFNDDLTELVMSGGTIADGQTWQPGAGDGNGEIVIDAVPASEGPLNIFKWDEQPIIGTVIPLPPAVWSGLIGLSAVGVLHLRRRFAAA